ncbi:hypothetical protein I551_7060 [Mycobacterium ulcerans str. Harvey]|uniref:Uncharacterized protein n=1 Tax=Mycobacterium ulcerans str. Harvey TaxID=1299332 RepID=A0ABN0QPE2_MYCUL|nr:hypothetical protein I551_7060 [Mycobacterium ulcerans str. Harvey]
MPTAVAPATQRTLLIIGPAELLGRPPRALGPASSPWAD